MQEYPNNNQEQAPEEESNAAKLLRIRGGADDKLHDEREVIREYDKVRQMAMDCGAAAFCISGAGPTLLCVCHDDHFADRMSEAVKSCENHWRVLQLEVDHEGAKVIED